MDIYSQQQVPMQGLSVGLQPGMASGGGYGGPTMNAGGYNVSNVFLNSSASGGLDIQGQGGGGGVGPGGMGVKYGIGVGGGGAGGSSSKQAGPGLALGGAGIPRGGVAADDPNQEEMLRQLFPGWF